jgi:hypothetical protein
VIETLGGTGTWSACHEPGTGWDWARSARVPSDTGTRVLGKSVTLQVPFWHCVHHGTTPCLRARRQLHSLLAAVQCAAAAANHLCSSMAFHHIMQHPSKLRGCIC